MSDMKILTGPDTRIVLDYDFTFVHGMSLPVTVDPEVGDTIQFNPDTIIVNLVAKPGVAGATDKLPPELVTISRQYLAVMQERKREVRNITPEEQAITDALIAKMNSLPGPSAPQ
jgi:hypothetical protein